MSTPDIQRGLAKRDQTVEITTTGRRTGRPHRIQVRLHNVGGRLFIMGNVGKRDWYANVRATPAFTPHLKEDVAADLDARATPIVEEAERRRFRSGWAPRPSCRPRICDFWTRV